MITTKKKVRKHYHYILKMPTFKGLIFFIGVIRMLRSKQLIIKKNLLPEYFYFTLISQERKIMVLEI